MTHHKRSAKEEVSAAVEAGAEALCKIDNPTFTWPTSFDQWVLDDYRARAKAVLDASAAVHGNKP